jgi:hypothetical protein
MKFSVVIIGLGNIGMLYDINLPKKKNILTHCNAFAQHPEFELIGGVETNSELRSSFEAEYQLHHRLTWNLLYLRIIFLQMYLL